MAGRSMLYAPRGHKYGAVPTTVDNITFDSKKEARRWCELLLLQKAGEIHELQRQVPFKLIVNGELITTYVADFVYVERKQIVTEDSKGYLTPEFKIKRRLMKAVHGIEIRLT